MKQLNWFNPDAPDESMYICGVEITPEIWCGGVVHFIGRNWVADYGQYAFLRDEAMTATRCGDKFMSDRYAVRLKPNGKVGGIDGDCHAITEYTHPVYPPVGFGGLSEDEIWNAMWRFYGADHIGVGEATYRQCIILSREWDFSGHVVSVDRYGNSPFFACGGEEDYGCMSPVIYSQDDMHTFIAALQNARVLSARLREAQGE